MLETLRREIYIVIHGQSIRFRVIKYLVFIGIIIILSKNYGLQSTSYFLLLAMIIALTAHFFFRWKTKGWRNSWGLYKKIQIPDKK
jgi:hypothetical protein